MQTAILTEDNKKTIKIIRSIVESVLARKEARLNAVQTTANAKSIGRSVYAIQHIRERWLWTWQLENIIANAMTEESESCL